MIQNKVPTASQIFQISCVKTYANLTFERKTLQEILIIEMLARLRHLRKWNCTRLHGNIESSTSTTDPLTGDPNSTAFIGHGVVGVVGGTDRRLRRYIELRHHKFTSIASGGWIVKSVDGQVFPRFPGNTPPKQKSSCRIPQKIIQTTLQR